MSRPTLDHIELKDFQAWKEEWQSATLTLQNYLYAKGSLDLAVAFIEYLWPKIVEHEECYFLSTQYSHLAFSSWKNELKNDKTRIELVMNHVHIYDMFESSGKKDQEYNLVVDEYIALIMKQSWEAALKIQFPAVSFRVTFATEPDDYGPTISFHALR